jgi:hypothetical protein
MGVMSSSPKTPKINIEEQATMKDQGTILGEEVPTRIADCLTPEVLPSAPHQEAPMDVPVTMDQDDDEDDLLGGREGGLRSIARAPRYGS